MWGLGSMIKALRHTGKTSSDYLPITISVMPWLMALIQGSWSFDFFQNVLESIHRKNKKCHVNTCTWGCQKQAKGNSEDHSGRECTPDDASTTGLRGSEHELAGSKKTEKLPRIPRIGVSDPGLDRVQRRCKSMMVLDFVQKP